MAIPKNITKDHLLRAIQKINEEGIPPGAQSRFYDLLYNNKQYPPKLVVSYANLFANGKILDRESFSGGKDTPCFKLLEKNGFTLSPKEDIYQVLTSFLHRVHFDPQNLKKDDFHGEFRGLQVEVGFGQGNQANIPWIALLREGQKVSKGIYPVYLYFKEQKILILAYGVSETYPAEINWKVNNPTLQRYFQDRGYGRPKRYGTSYFFSTYLIDVERSNFGLDRSIINQDIERIIKEYNDIPLHDMHDIKDFNYESFVESLNASGLNFDQQTVLRFVTSIVTKPFIILTGLSGSGKTNLAIAFAKWIVEDKKQFCIVPVGADWTNREPLLGFPNMLQSEKYILPEHGALDLILNALSNPSKPYFLILDEMNLSHVERYFADFLSCMESQSEISLHIGPNNWNGGKVPKAFVLPPNLFIIGTVNIDETTYMFSPKVLDRAFVIEFRINAKEMEAFFKNATTKKPFTFPGPGFVMAQSFVELASDKDITNGDSFRFSEELLMFFDTLKDAGAEFGYRTASEIMLFTKKSDNIGKWSDHALMDAIIMQKLLPKLHGSRRKMDPILRTLAGFCLVDGKKVDQFLNTEGQKNVNFNDEDVKYPLSLEKIQRMYRNLLDHSFTSYAEA